jgi:hypothetical protein
MLHILADAFALLPEETMWAGFCLDDILGPVGAERPESVPLAVRHEMTTGEYTARLERAETSDRTDRPVHDASLRVVPAEEWAAVLLHMVTACYTLRPLVESSLHGRLVGMLRELGVGDAGRPRPTRYLPNDLRERLSKTGP